MADSKINWMNDFEKGLDRAREEKKPLFLDFFKEDWVSLQRFYPQRAWSMRSNIL